MAYVVDFQRAAAATVIRETALHASDFIAHLGYTTRAKPLPFPPDNKQREDDPTTSQTHMQQKPAVRGHRSHDEDTRRVDHNVPWGEVPFAIEVNDLIQRSILRDVHDVALVALLVPFVDHFVLRRHVGCVYG